MALLGANWVTSLQLGTMYGFLRCIEHWSPRSSIVDAGMLGALGDVVLPQAGDALDVVGQSEQFSMVQTWLACGNKA